MNAYDRAAATWIERRFGYAEGSVSNVTFENFGPGCDTCGYGGGYGFEFQHEGRTVKQDMPYDVTPGKFIEECVALL